MMCAIWLLFLHAVCLNTVLGRVLFVLLGIQTEQTGKRVKELKGAGFFVKAGGRAVCPAQLRGQ